ncbi:MAG: preprotein translocase subunit Sec61beta [Candidatus Geothermarchaeales archaeon]
MSRRKRRDAPMPASTAGLLRFFEDSTEGIRIKPTFILGFSVIFMIISFILWWFYPVI